MTYTLPDGTMVDLTDSVYDASGNIVLTDGTVIYAGGQGATLPNGDVILPSGAVAHADGSLTTPDGVLVPASTPLPDGTSTGEQVAKVFQAGGSILAGLASLLGQVRQLYGGGQVQGAVRLPDGSIRLPDGRIIRAQTAAGLFSGMNLGGTGMLLLVGLGVYALSRGRRAA